MTAILFDIISVFSRVAAEVNTRKQIRFTYQGSKLIIFFFNFTIVLIFARISFFTFTIFQMQFEWTHTPSSFSFPLLFSLFSHCLQGFDWFQLIYRKSKNLKNLQLNSTSMQNENDVIAPSMHHDAYIPILDYCGME